MANILQPKEISQLCPLKKHDKLSLEGGKALSIVFLFLQKKVGHLLEGENCLTKNLRAVTRKHGKHQQLLKKKVLIETWGILDYPNRSFSRFRNLSG